MLLGSGNGVLPLELQNDNLSWSHPGVGGVVGVVGREAKEWA